MLFPVIRGKQLDKRFDDAFVTGEVPFLHEHFRSFDNITHYRSMPKLPLYGIDWLGARNVGSNPIMRHFRLRIWRAISVRDTYGILATG